MTTDKNKQSDMPENQSLINFPEKFPIKIFGHKNDDFCALVTQVINKHVDEKHQIKIEEKLSGKGNYLAITVTIMAQSQAQLDAVYYDLTASPLVKMAL